MENSIMTSLYSENLSYDRVNSNSTKSILSDLGKKSCKDSNAAYHLTPFLIKVLGIGESSLTIAISKSIVDLDNLAQQIDAEIDVENSTMPIGLNYNNFENLELKIVECFSHLSNAENLEKLISDTLECVNRSFKYNTSERHLIYNFRNTEFCGCTTYYLFPLVKYLFTHSKFQTKNERLFFLVANYIQLLDDYIDVFVYQ